MSSEKSEVWVTGIGLVSSLGEGLETHWAQLNSDTTPVPSVDTEDQAPFPVHPIVDFSLETQIPKRSDQRQMGPWQRLGTYTAGLALADAGVAGNPDLLAQTNMIVAAGGGERDLDLEDDEDQRRGVEAHVEADLRAADRIFSRSARSAKWVANASTSSRATRRKKMWALPA